MCDEQFILSLVQIVLSAMTPLMAFWLGRISTNSNHKLNTAKKQFENFYLPYIQMYYRGMMWEIRFSEMSLEARESFLDLIMGQLHYANPTAQRLIPDFYTSWLELLEYRNGKCFNEPPDIHIDTLFYRLTEIVFSEYKLLCLQLQLPLPITPPLPNHAYIE